MITIVDYGVGNVGSIVNMLRRIGADATVAGDADAIRRAEKLLLPGVGSFDRAIQAIDQQGLRDVLEEKALDDRVPILGICLGMQLLTRGSEEGQHPGFGWIDANTRRFPHDPHLKVPHMGWNLVTRTKENQMTAGLAEGSRFYFVHSFYVEAHRSTDVLLKTNYGVEFAAAVASDNIFGAQFHPEKSHRYGMQFLKNFALLD